MRVVFGFGFPVEKSKGNGVIGAGNNSGGEADFSTALLTIGL
jgi:hypothetical protein